MTGQKQEREDLQAVQKEYADAIARNQTAKSRLQKLLQAKQPKEFPHGQFEHQTSNQRHQKYITQPTKSKLRHHRHRHERLTQHLHNLRLEQQYSNLHTLAAYSKEINDLAEREHLYNIDNFQRLILEQQNSQNNQISDVDDAFSPPRHHRGTEPGLTIDAQQEKKVADLQKHAQHLISSLELALVSTRLDLQREKALLEATETKFRAVKSDSPSTAGQNSHDKASFHDLAMNTKLQALEATRTELQTWIAETLARCEEPVAAVAEDSYGTGHNQSQRGDMNVYGHATDDDLIQKEYSRYIAVRTRLLGVLEALRRPLPPPPSTVAAAQNTSEHDPTTAASSSGVLTLPQPLANHSHNRNNPPPPSHLRHKSRVSLTYTTKTAEHITGPPLPAIEALYIPAREHEKVLSAYAAQLKRQTHVQDARTLEMLNLLSHESHLLPAYSVAASASATATTLGKGNTSVGRRTVDDHGGRNFGGENEDDAETLTREGVEIEKFLGMWASAAQAADEKLAEGIERDVDEAERALRGSEGYVEEWEELERMRLETLKGSRSVRN